MTTAQERTVERFKKRTVWFHWVHTLAFVVLLVTGMFLFFPGLGIVAQDTGAAEIPVISVIVLNRIEDNRQAR